MRKWVFVAICVLIVLTATSTWAVPEMIVVKAGTFQMGNTRNDSEGMDEEKPVHEVKLTYDYEIGKYEVKFYQYDAYCAATGKNAPRDGNWGRGKRPVIYVTWYDAIGYCNWLSEQEGLAKAYDNDGNLLDKNGRQTTDITQVEGYRLPTEAEWEYAARGGHEDITNGNEAKDFKYAGSSKYINKVAWYRNNSNKTQFVGLKAANALGLYDMSGNVWEWCTDMDGAYSQSPTENPVNLNFSTYRTARGGSWFNYIGCCRVSHRTFGRPDFGDSNIGFRVAKTQSREQEIKTELVNSGSVYIKSFPSGASIYIEDHYRGVTPKAIEGLKVADYTLTLKKDCYDNKIINLTIKEGKTENLDLTLEKTLFETVLVQGDAFQMGNTLEISGGKDEKPVHTVKLLYNYYIGKTEVTFNEYDAYCEATGIEKAPDYSSMKKYYMGRGNKPVINVSWYDAIAYCNWVSEQEGLAKAYDNDGNLLDKNGRQTTDITQVEGYRLPTEAEWEYAARGGHKSKEDYQYAGSNTIYLLAWYWGNTQHKTQMVGQKAPNELGLYDMSGNVEEWCYDWYGSYTSATKTNPIVLDRSSDRVVIRGGYWSDDDEDCRVADRRYFRPDKRTHSIGFRIAKTQK